MFLSLNIDWGEGQAAAPTLAARLVTSKDSKDMLSNRSAGILLRGQAYTELGTYWETERQDSAIHVYVFKDIRL
jgi:hypothetical protein